MNHARNQYGAVAGDLRSGILLILVAATVGCVLVTFGTLADAAEPVGPGLYSMEADSSGVGRVGHWGPEPARTDTVSATFLDRDTSDWEDVAMVPYEIVGLPFRLAYLLLHQGVVGLDKLGFFSMPPAEYPGLAGPWNTFIMPFLAIESLEGTTLGANITRPRFLGPGNTLFLTGSASTRKAQKLAGGTLFQIGNDWQLQVGAGTEEVPQVRFYGLGYDSRGGDLSYYYRGVSWGGFEVDRDLGKRFGLDLRSYFSKVVAKESGYQTDQSLEKVHADDIPYGFPGTSRGLMYQVGLHRNNTLETGRPDQGGFQSAGISLFHATDGSDLRYLTYRFNLEKYFSLWHTKRTLVLRGFYNRLDNIGDEPIPFTRLLTFSRPDELRGLQTLRYYGLGSLGLTVEYRWPVWSPGDRDGMGLDAYVFSDNGQVFDHKSEIALNHLEFTGGVGFRLIGKGGNYMARMELGFSDEEPIFRLKFSQNFQYDAKGFLYGKDPTKVR